MQLYLKYRPKSLAEFVGNENVVAVLKTLFLKKSEFPSVILLSGSSGCGKTTLARIVKSELNVEDSDFTELNAANTRGIDTIREVIEICNYSTFSGGNRLFLLDEAHKLTSDAQNSLLKILEDTPSKVYFILCTTDPEKVIKTVRNRCTTLVVKQLPEFMILSLLDRVCKLENKSVSKDILREISKVCLGSARQALIILESIIDLHDSKKALEIINDSSVDSVKIIDICRLLLTNTKDKWLNMVPMIKGLGDADIEQSRLAILNYFSAVLLNLDKSKEDQEFLVSIMRIFSKSFIYLGKGSFILALWEAANVDPHGIFGKSSKL